MTNLFGCQAALRAAGERGPQVDLALPAEAHLPALERSKFVIAMTLFPEDRGKVVFLDVDGVLRPARAGA